jgi:O-antigen/teichoic acid export membrane protein
VIVIYLARILPVSGFGQIAFAQTIVTIYFFFITDFGLQTLGARNIARDRAKRNYYLINILCLRSILAVISFGLLCVLALLIKKDELTKQLLLLYGLSIFTTAFLIEWVFQGLEEMKQVGVGKVLNKIIYFALILIFVRGLEDIRLIPLFWFSGTLAASFYLFYVYFKKDSVRVEMNTKEWPSIFIEALPMGFSFLVVALFHSLDTVMLGLMKSNTHVGWYNTADKLIITLLGISVILSRVLFPVLARYYKDARDKLEILIKTAFKYIAVIAYPLGFGGVILAKPIMLLFFGEKYLNAVIVFQILIWTVVVCLLRMLFMAAALACERQITYMKGALLGVTVNILLNLLLIPKFDIRGAALATLSGDCVFGLYMIIRFNLTSRKFILSYSIKPFLTSIIMGIALYYYREVHLGLTIPLGIFIYIVLLLMFRHITLEELRDLKEKIFGNTT